MRRALLAILALAALAPGTATGKEGIERLEVCGSAGCKTVSNPDLVIPLIAGLHDVKPRPVPAPAAFFTLIPEPTAGWPEAWPRYTYVPDAQLVLVEGRDGDATWLPLTWTDGAYERATRNMTPFPEPVSWSARWTAAPKEPENRLPAALGFAVALAVAGAGVGLFSYRRRRQPD